MASAHVARRRWLNAKGDPVTRYHVRARLGGRGWPLIHLGSFKTQREAEIRLRFVEDEIAAGRDPRVVISGNADKGASVATVCDKWLASRHDYRDATRTRVMREVRRIKESPLGRVPVGSVTREHIQKYLSDTLIGGGLAPGSIRNNMVALKQVLDYADLDPNPARHRSIKIPKNGNAPVTVPSRDECEKIKDAANGDYRLAIRMIEATGARSDELCQCEWRDFNLGSAEWRIRGTKTETSIRTVPLPDDVVGALRERVRSGDRVFPNFTISLMWNNVNRACKRAGTLLYNPKSFRHLYGSRLVAAGVPIPQVALLMGHKNQSTTMKYYLHVLPENASGDASVMDVVRASTEVPANETIS